MNLLEVLKANFNIQNLVIKGAYVICIAIAFEIIALFAAYRIDKWTSSFLNADTGREANWRVKRRAILRGTPKMLSRAVCYTIAIILVFDVFGVPVLPLSLAVGSVLAFCGAGMLLLGRDAAQGYALLAEDALAVGDLVHVNGHEGVVEKFTLRALVIRDKEGRAHILSNRDVQTVVVIKRRAEEQNTSRDPNALPPHAQSPRKTK